MGWDKVGVFLSLFVVYVSYCLCFVAVKLFWYFWNEINTTILGVELYNSERLVVQAMVQQPEDCLSSGRATKLALVAISKTSSTASPVKDEHSMYFLAPM